MLKRKSIDYIFGMITGASLMVAFWACAGNNLSTYNENMQEVNGVKAKWNPVYVKIVD